MINYYSKDGDVLDELVWKQYPDYPVRGTTEQVLAANPGLAEYGPVLPMGLVIVFPDPKTITRPKAAKSWIKFWQ
jgi:phage tail protein X